MDISRAFDVVSYPHLHVLTKLQTLGLSSKMYLWIAAFLSNPQQCVKLINEYSSIVNLTSGVYQGTILSIILFLIYINDIADNLRCKRRLYADNCVLYHGVYSIDEAVTGGSKQSN